jgi:hypothetical protein
MVQSPLTVVPCPHIAASPAHASQERALRDSERQRLPCRALSGMPCQPYHRGGPNDAGPNRPAVPPQCLLYLQPHSPSAWASDLPHLPPTVTTLVSPLSLSKKKAPSDAIPMERGAIQ